MPPWGQATTLRLRRILSLFFLRCHLDLELVDLFRKGRVLFSEHLANEALGFAEVLGQVQFDSEILFV